MTIEKTGNIVRLKGFKNSMKFAPINEVMAYWEGLLAGRQVPMRSEVNPRGIESALAHSFILERVAPGVARFRLAGLHLSDLLGIEVRGMPFTSFFTPNARKHAAEILESAFQSPEVAQISLTAEKGIGKPTLKGKIILLPLKSDLGDITRILGCFVTEGEIGRAPRRFTVTERKSTSLAPTAPVSPAIKESQVESHGVTDNFVPGFEEPKPNFKGAQQKPGRPYLRLLKFRD